MKSLSLILITFISFAFANNLDQSPNINYSNYYSSTHPLTLDELLSITLGQERFINFNDDFHSHTYVRCYYKSPNKTGADLSANYIWAKNRNNSYYKLSGYWSSENKLMNIFYTNILNTEIQQVCNQSLNSDNKGNLLDIYAANNALSLDYMIWHNNITSTSRHKFDRIVAFGDSLSDTHNLYNATQWQLPNKNSWFLGRFSNGPVWIEYISKNLNIPYYNWSVGGATAGNKKIATSNLTKQIDSFSQYMLTKKDYTPQKTLFTIWIGGNDFIDILPIENAIIGINYTITELIDLGGRNILILNMPDITTAPIFKTRKDASSAKDKINKFNNILAQEIAKFKLQTPELNIKLFDTYTEFDNIKNSPEKFGISNINDSCLDLKSNSTLNHLTIQNIHPECTNQNAFIFWDSLHPTTAVHRILATKITELLAKEQLN